MRYDLTLDRLREVLSYSRKTGEFRWKVQRGKCCPGDVAGSQMASGYVEIRVDWDAYLAHILAWFYCTGKWPEGEVDHKNGERACNRFRNLRDVPGRVNKQNLRKPRKDNKSGFLGVHWSTQAKKWRACLGHEGRKICLGFYTDPRKAHKAYLKAKRELHQGCTI